MADAAIFHLNAAGYHFVNAVFHAVNGALLFLLLWRLTGLMPPAAVAAALFAWHPMHVESVAWVSERKDVLSTFFALLALLSYTQYARQNRRPDLWLALLFFALGLLAKPMLVTLPFVLLLLDYWPLDRMRNAARLRDTTARQECGVRDFKRLIVEKIPFFALAAASCVVTCFAQQAGQAVVSLESLPLQYRLEYPPLAVIRYLLKLSWPAHLAFFYPYRPVAGATLALAAAALVLITTATWLARKKSPCWLVGWLWFLGTLVPVIGLVQVGGASIADRYTYLPSIGLFVAIAFGLYELKLFKKALPAVAALPLIACLLLTEKQIGFWHNSETLLRHTIAVTENNERAHYVLGVALDQAGRRDEALGEYREVLKINPAHYQMHVPIGDDLASLGRPAEALNEYQQALNENPQTPVLHISAGRALLALGNLPAARGEFAEAERLNPNDARPHLELATNYCSLGMDDQAVKEWRTAAEVQPDDVGALTAAAYHLAANTNAAARDEQSALILALEAKGLATPQQQSEVFDVLGMAFASTGDFTSAIMCAQKALELAFITNLNDTVPIQTRLALYRNHQPWLESFRGTNGPP
jgi:Flp pilus assembly protein TadD